MGVPTLRLKLVATTVSGVLMGLAGAPFPYYVTFVEPTSVVRPQLRGEQPRDAHDRREHDLDGPRHRRGAAGTAQQIATVTISSALNFLLVGLILVAFVILAPEGIVGLVRRLARRRDV